jgi:hypothetical protein
MTRCEGVAILESRQYLVAQLLRVCGRLDDVQPPTADSHKLDNMSGLPD